mgnify:CR=1 FL=1
MAVPKRKKSKSKSRIRKNENTKFNVMNYHFCSNCKIIKFPHNVCLKCGFYSGKKVLEFKIKKGVD